VVSAIIILQTRKENKTMTKNEMLTLVIQKFGFEHQHTVEFAEAIEWLGLAESENLLYETLDLPIEADEDGE
jgi:hypothetical protein